LNLNTDLNIENIDDEAEINKKVNPAEDPNNLEKDILRYYYYIHNGIDTEHVAPLEQARVVKVMSLLTEKLRKNYPQLVADLTDEVREDYMLSVKKAIVDFVLRDDSKEIEDEKSNKLRSDEMPEYKLELAAVPKPWHHAYEKNRKEIDKNLHLINPCMAQLLKLWHTSFK
jgi:dynein heavy chain